MSYETITYEKIGHKAVITLNRPESMNSFNRAMSNEMVDVWSAVKSDDDVWVTVLTAAGDRAFCVGVDVKESSAELDTMTQFERWRQVPGSQLTARQNGCLKPVITAVNGMCAGGGFYFIADSDIIICSENATFFDPHITYGRVAAVEPIGLTHRMPFGEVMRSTITVESRYTYTGQESDGESGLARMCSLIQLGDWVSFWLAMRQHVDPSPVGSIQQLKGMPAEG